MSLSPYLIWSLAALLAGLAVFTPRIGLLARWRAYRAAGRREQVEDALKYLLKREHAGQYASLDALAGVLHLSGEAALRLVGRMETQGLLQSRNSGLHLTPDGERWALQVVRAHRLWERYLADEARLPLDRIHKEAERREHHLTSRELDDLDAMLGHPQQDPHGDPIPTREGRLARDQGVPLTAWPKETPGRIVHLEDEPPIAYEQIQAEGLRLGQVLHILAAAPDRILLSDGENEYRLAPSVAANVYLEAIPEAPASQPGVMPLSVLPDGARAEVVALDEACQGFTRRRLLDLGMTPGVRLSPEMRNFIGDPRAYRLRGTLIALRREQAEQIWVKEVEN